MKSTPVTMHRIIILLAAATLLTSCNITINTNDIDQDYGPVETRTYALDGTYHELEVSHAFDVTMCDTVSVPTITIAADLHDRVVFLIEDGTLKIKLKKGTTAHTSEASVLLPYNPSLCDIDLSGASSFTSSSPLLAKEISIDLTGASLFSGEIKQATKLELDASGASTAYLSGSTAELDIDLSGACHLDASNFDASNVEGDMSGASSANVLCCESLRMDVSGASHLSYRTLSDGCTPVVKCHTSGASSVTNLD